MSDRDSTEEISHPVFAAIYDALLPLEDRFVGPHREYLVADLDGRVLDLGAGSGATFPYAASAASAASTAVDGNEENGAANGDEVTGTANADASIEYHAVEPDPHMRKRAAERAREVDLPIDLRSGRAESLPYPDDAFDVVLSAVVFCTVADPAAALDEVARVLTPGGEFRFLEHVRADGWRARGQDLLTPVWKRTSGGCHLNRNTVSRFVAHDAFGVIEVEETDVGGFPSAPIVRGRLRRRREGRLR